MTGERIFVRGPKMRVALIGAILARRWAGEGRELVLSPEQEDAPEVTAIARPDHIKVHGELGLRPDDLVQKINSVPVFAVEVLSADGKVSLPFSPFGVARSGVEFHHYWQRAEQAAPQTELPDFSLALRLHKAGGAVPLSAVAQLPLQFGLRLDRERYSQMLLALASSLGARIESFVSSDADLTIDCRAGVGEPGWDANILTVTQADDIPGVEWQVCANATWRLLGLMTDLSDSKAEQREYTRLAREEVERIEDFRMLLTNADTDVSDRPSLQRKIDLFKACGRIPTEDFEFFAPPEWLAALWSRGIRPKRHDRMANALPEAELHNWLAGLQRQIGEIADRSQTA